MTKVYLGLGTNIGNKRRNLITAAALLAERAGDVLAISSFYETVPWGFQSESMFLNAALLLETDMPVGKLLSLTQDIEQELGRTRKSDGAYHDRTIDIDLLLYGDEVIDEPRLTIPHPWMHTRMFVMEPLAEIAPFVRHPLLGETMYDLMLKLRDENPQA